MNWRDIGSAPKGSVTKRTVGIVAKLCYHDIEDDRLHVEWAFYATRMDDGWYALTRGLTGFSGGPAWIKLSDLEITHWMPVGDEDKALPAVSPSELGIMTASQMIARLAELIALHGDQPVKYPIKHMSVRDGDVGVTTVSAYNAEGNQTGKIIEFYLSGSRLCR